MNEVEIRFERENRDGVVPTGTYLGDAAKRLGIRFEPECEPAKGIHTCEVDVIQGAEILSEPTRQEKEHFNDESRSTGNRLACQARIDEPGEITVMTKEKVKEQTPSDAKDSIQEEFASLPLEKKIANLVKMEAATIGETISFVINSPFEVFQKVGDVVAEFGLKLETQAKKASRPDEHVSKENENASGESESINGSA